MSRQKEINLLLKNEEKVCLNCGDSIFKWQKFCSRQCYFKHKIASNQDKLRRFCQVCGRVTRNKMFCSRSCSNGIHTKQRMSLLYGEKPIRKCMVCQTDTSNGKYCSWACFSSAEFKVRKPCLFCGKETKNSKFCSSKCFGDSIRMHPILEKHPCEYCGEITRNQKYCSLRCFGFSLENKKLSPERIEKHRQRMLGKKYHFGMKVDEEGKRNISLGHLNSDYVMFEETRNKLRESTTRNWQEPEYARKVSAGVQAKWNDPEYSQKVSAGIRAKWNDPAYKDKTVMAIMRGNDIHPNKPERLLNTLLLKNFPDEWKYVGDGSFVINGKNPDFINIASKKQVIELFGDYWHRNDNGIERINLFKSKGYDTMIIWEHELKNTEAVIDKIISFFPGGK